MEKDSLTKLDPYAIKEKNIQKEYRDKIRQDRLKTLVIIVIIASLVWGFVGSADLLIISAVQHLFPTKTKLQYAFIQIFIYIVLLMIIIYITDIDASSLFVSSNHFKLGDAI